MVFTRGLVKIQPCLIFDILNHENSLDMCKLSHNGYTMNPLNGKHYIKDD